MQDRIPGAPGQYAMKIDSESLHKFLNAEECTVVLQRDDHPIVEGTPLNKATFLPDDLAAELCPDIEDPTPADAVRKLARKTNEAYAATESEEYPGCYYRTVDGVTEWLNPPMVPGVEYRTTERFNEKPVYTKSVYIDALPNATEKWVEHEISPLDLEYPVSINIGLKSATWAITMPMLSKEIAGLSFALKHIYIKTTSDMSVYSGYAKLKYTKK